MKRVISFWVVFLILLLQSAFSQDFSNKGKDFWVAYGYHQVMRANNPQEMVLYFATDAITTVKVEIPGLGYSQTYSNIPANTIFTSNPLPKAGSQDARLLAEGISSQGIHITSDKPVVAYTHIYNQSVSGATLLFPTATLGKDYFSINYEQISNTNEANCWVYAIAVDTGSTTIEVTPSENTITHPAGVPFTVTLQQGQVLNLMGVLTTNSSPFRGVDLTGTRIRSIGTGTAGCKRIAVFSGSGRISVSCSPSAAPSSDNYIVQAFPQNAWGKKYLTVPTRTLQNNFFRICVSDPTTIVTFNGSPISGLQKNFFYQLNTSQPGIIEANKPIMVAQVITSQGECSNGSPGDPEVIYLSPVEQNIDKVILNSTSNFAITQHWINVVIKANAVSNFRIDGLGATGSFVPHPRDPNYAYAQLSVGAGQHTLTADSGFNAIAYGYGNAESYGYNGGTNVRDLYQFVSLQNQFATVNFPATCKNTPFFFSMTFPYQPTQIKWIFGAALNSLGISDVTVNSPVFDSTWTVNGKPLYRYKLPNTFYISAAGTYPIKVLAQNPTPDGCNGEQEITYEVVVKDRPAAAFSIASSGCVSDPVSFTDNSNTFGQPAVKWFWDFADGQNSTIKNPSHQYTAANTYNVKFAVVTDIGCVSDTITKAVVLAQPPVAKFGVSTPYCAGKPIVFSDSSTSSSSPIVKWTWSFGDGSTQVVSTTNASQTHTFANPGAYTITLLVENAAGCKSVLGTKTITVTSNPATAFNFGKACLPNGAVQFTDASGISDGTQNSFTFQWYFGDGATSQAKNPSHVYSTVGPHNASLVVYSSAGCKDSIAKIVDSVYAQPMARFTAPAEVCFGTAVSFSDQSTAQNSTVTTWQWNFGDGSAVSYVRNPTHTYTSPGSYSVTLVAGNAQGCSSTIEQKQIIINALPSASFTPSSPTCINSVINFTDNSVANSGSINKWTWNFGTGASGSAQQSPSFTYPATGTYPVSLQVETDKGCVSATETKNVIVSHVPQPGFMMPGNCVNDPISQFTDTSKIADGTASQFTYLWNFDDANANGANPNTSSVKNPTHKFTATGNYHVSLTVTSTAGCSATTIQTFTINGAVPVSSFSVKNGLQHCSNDSIYVTDNSTVAPGRLIKMEIYWDYNGDQTNKTVIDNPTPGTTYAHKYPEFFTPASQNFSMRMINYSGATCSNFSEQTVTIKATPEIDFPRVSAVCADASSFSLQANAINMVGGTGVYAGRGVSPNGLFNPGTATGNNFLTYTYTGTNGCTNADTQTVVVYPVPTVNAGPDRFVLEGGSATLTPTASGSGLTYLWTPGIYLNNPTAAQPISTPRNDVQYILTVTTADGCSKTDEVLVKLLKSPVIPNVFSPNNDGINDRWEVKYLESYPGATVEIFNRYGQKVFESRGYTKPWDGTFKGSQLPAGTYYYIINPKNGRQQLAGYVDIIR